MMERRKFLISSGLSTMAVFAGVEKWFGEGQFSYSHLTSSLRPLFDTAFKDVAENTQADVLFITLSKKGVIDKDNNINALLVKSLARVDRAVEYKGCYYSPTELELYSLSYLLNRQRRG